MWTIFHGGGEFAEVRGVRVGPGHDRLVLPRDAEAPCSVLLVEHHMDLVMGVCDQVVVLDFGRCVASGTPDEVRADPAVATAYLGQDIPDEDIQDDDAATQHPGGAG